MATREMSVPVQAEMPDKDPVSETAGALAGATVRIDALRMQIGEIFNRLEV